ncbi:MAG TPA: hypothetical protein VNH64_08485, partial [Parvularculaceae bacterium]|nr:hypothetical protein [Parvularculaceae bacterium]
PGNRSSHFSPYIAGVTGQRLSAAPTGGAWRQKPPLFLPERSVSLGPARCRRDAPTVIGERAVKARNVWLKTSNSITNIIPSAR